jgi:hypothetical protein
MARKKLGEILLERGLIDNDQLNSALAYQRQWGHRLGVALVAKGFITEGMLIKVLGETLGLPTVDLSKVTFDSSATRLVSYNTCENNDLIPISLEETRGARILTLAMADPMNMTIIDEIEFTTGCKIRPVLSTISAINSAVRKYYRGQNTIIKPLILQQPEATGGTGRMQLVRPGGDVEVVDTSTYEDSGKVMQLVDEVSNAAPDEAPGETAEDVKKTRSRVAEIKARRAERISKETSKGISSEEAMEDYLAEVQTAELEALQKIEKYFWALMRVMARKGMITKEEFLRELNE